jgi:AraC-like DNA-binding protein
VLQRKDPRILESEFWTDDLDSARANVQASGIGEHSRVALDADGFRWGYSAVAVGNLVAGVVTTSGRQVVQATVGPATAVMHVPIQSGAEYRLGRRTVTTSGKRAILLPAQQSYTLMNPGGTIIAIVLNADVLMEMIENIAPGRKGHRAVRATPIDLSHSSHAALLSLRARIKRIGAKRNAIGVPAELARLEADFVEWLSRELLRQQGVVALSPRVRQRVEFIELWIDEHLGEEIGLQRLTDIAGVGAHALAKATSAARGVSPLEMVMHRRLRAARSLLETGRANTVAGVAEACGIAHLGRFSGAYKQVFGESPSDTIARRREEHSAQSRSGLPVGLSVQ